MDAADALTFNSVKLLLRTLTSGHVYVGNSSNLATDVAMSGDVGIDNSGATTIQAGAITNAKVNASAAIAYSKLALTGSILNADINASAAIAYSKLALTGSIVNADVSASAAIAVSKLAALTVSSNVRSDASGLLTTGSVALGSEVSGTLPINHGGTNSVAALSNGRLMVSSGSAIVENPNGQMANGRILIADSSGNPVSTGAASLNGNLSFGATSTQGIVGTTAGDGAAAGNVGETLEASVTSFTNAATSTQYGDITSVSLTAGTYLMYGLGSIFENGATITRFQVGISTTTGNSATGLTTGLNTSVFDNLSLGGNGQFSATVVGYLVKPTVTTTYYLKGRITYSVATAQWAGHIIALRIH